MKPFLSKIVSLSLISSLFSLNGCASYSGGGDASGWANAEREVLIEGAVMLPLAIISLPVTLPYTLVKEGLKSNSQNKEYNDRNNSNNKYNKDDVDLTRYVEVDFLSLNQNEYSTPTLYYNRVKQRYHAWIPVYEADFKDINKANHLKAEYATTFQNMVTTIPSNENWIAYQYQKNNWLVLDQGCEAQGIYSKDQFNHTINRTDDILKIEILCKKHD